MNRDILGSVLLAVGVALAGIFVGWGFSKGRSSDRYVTVKGISEHEVGADLAIWPIRLVAADNNLATAHSQLQKNLAQVKQFLSEQNIDTANLSMQDFSVNDAYANQYGGTRITNRYIINQTLVVRSTNPEQVLAASQHVAELVNSGVVFSSGEQYGNSGPTFVFTKLNDLKPEMIAEATARAREAAEQFARDANSDVGSIRRANQGVFQITGRDEAGGVTQSSQIDKKVRVVSTIEYFLR